MLLATEIWISIGFTAIWAIGLIRIRNFVTKYENGISFLYLYREKYIKLTNALVPVNYYGGDRATFQYFDNELYNWLTINAVKAQWEVGSFGIGEFLGPYQRYHIKNYEFITNTVSKLRNDNISFLEINTVDDILLRRIGHYNNVIDNLRKTLRNPFMWLSHGMRVLLGIPLQLLSWFGVISEGNFNYITKTKIFRVTSGMISILSVTSALITIFTSWQTVINSISQWFR